MEPFSWGAFFIGLGLGILLAIIGMAVWIVVTLYRIWKAEQAEKKRLAEQRKTE